MVNDTNYKRIRIDNDVSEEVMPVISRIDTADGMKFEITGLRPGVMRVSHQLSPTFEMLNALHMFGNFICEWIESNNDYQFYRVYETKVI